MSSLAQALLLTDLYHNTQDSVVNMQPFAKLLTQLPAPQLSQAELEQRLDIAALESHKGTKLKTLELLVINAHRHAWEQIAHQVAQGVLDSQDFVLICEQGVILASNWLERVHEVIALINDNAILAQEAKVINLAIDNHFSFAHLTQEQLSELGIIAHGVNCVASNLRPQLNILNNRLASQYADSLAIYHEQLQDQVINLNKDFAVAFVHQLSFKGSAAYLIRAQVCVDFVANYPAAKAMDFTPEQWHRLVEFKIGSIGYTNPPLAINKYRAGEICISINDMRLINWQRRYQITSNIHAGQQGTGYNFKQEYDARSFFNKGYSLPYPMTLGYDFLANAHKFVFVSASDSHSLSKFYQQPNTAGFIPLVIPQISQDNVAQLTSIFNEVTHHQGSATLKTKNDDITQTLMLYRLFTALAADESIDDNELIVVANAQLQFNFDWYQRLNQVIDYSYSLIPSQKLLFCSLGRERQIAKLSRTDLDSMHLETTELGRFSLGSYHGVNRDSNHQQQQSYQATYHYPDSGYSYRGSDSDTKDFLWVESINPDLTNPKGNQSNQNNPANQSNAATQANASNGNSSVVATNATTETLPEFTDLASNHWTIEQYRAKFPSFKKILPHSHCYTNFEVTNVGDSDRASFDFKSNPYQSYHHSLQQLEQEIEQQLQDERDLKASLLTTIAPQATMDASQDSSASNQAVGAPQHQATTSENASDKGAANPSDTTLSYKELQQEQYLDNVLAATMEQAVDPQTELMSLRKFNLKHNDFILFPKLLVSNAVSNLFNQLVTLGVNPEQLTASKSEPQPADITTAATATTAQDAATLTKTALASQSNSPRHRLYQRNRHSSLAAQQLNQDELYQAVWRFMSKCGVDFRKQATSLYQQLWTQAYQQHNATTSQSVTTSVATTTPATAKTSRKANATVKAKNKTKTHSNKNKTAPAVAPQHSTTNLTKQQQLAVLVQAGLLNANYELQPEHALWQELLTGVTQRLTAIAIADIKQHQLPVAQVAPQLLEQACRLRLTQYVQQQILSCLPEYEASISKQVTLNNALLCEHIQQHKLAEASSKLTQASATLIAAVARVQQVLTQEYLKYLTEKQTFATEIQLTQQQVAQLTARLSEQLEQYCTDATNNISPAQLLEQLELIVQHYQQTQKTSNSATAACANATSVASDSSDAQLQAQLQQLSKAWLQLVTPTDAYVANFYCKAKFTAADLLNSYRSLQTGKLDGNFQRPLNQGHRWHDKQEATPDTTHNVYQCHPQLR